MSYTFLPKRIYRMPTHFGPTPGPRQRPDGGRHHSADSPEIVSYCVSFLTDAAQLHSYLPPRFNVRGEPVITVEMSTIRRVDFLAGRGYNVLGVYFPVTFDGRDGRVHGDLLAVLWENMADPIISGRDELGFSKIYADIPDPEERNGTFDCRAAWDAHVFCELSVSNLRPAPTPAKPADYSGLLHYKYIPASRTQAQTRARFAHRRGAWARRSATVVRRAGNGSCEAGVLRTVSRMHTGATLTV